MRDYTYNFEIEDLIVQFINAFNDVVIKRYNTGREEQDQIHVNFVYAPKKRILHDILNKNPNPTNLPVIAVYISGVARDVNRVENKISNSYFLNDSGDFKQRRQPVPVKVDMGMSVITKSNQDMLQLLSNWIPYTDPYIFIDVEDPSTGQTLRTKVKWNETINLNQEIDNPESTYRTGFDTTFTIEGYLFKKIIPDADKICKITANFSSVTALNNCFLDIKDFENTIGLLSTNKETVTIEGVAKMTCISPWLLTLGHPEYDFTITGQNLDFITSLYVSGCNDMFPTSAYDYYNFFPDLSADVPINQCTENPSTSTDVLTSKCQPFYGIKIPSYLVNYTGTSLQFTLPVNPVWGGIFDVIAVTPCGCSKLSVDSISQSVNPYPSGSPQYESYVDYLPPYAKYGGVVVETCDNGLTILKETSSLWDTAYTNLTANSAAYLSDSDLTVLIANSAYWISVYNTVSSNSATTWNYQGEDLKALSAYWDSAYTNLTANSANWDTAYNTSTSYQSNSSSFATFNYVNSSFLPLSGGIMSGDINLGDNNITNINTLCATSIHAISTFTQYEDITIYELCGFGITGNIAVTGDIIATGNLSSQNSPRWDSVYNTVSANSATLWNYQGNDLKALSSYWQTAYSNLTSTSAPYLTGADPLVLISNSANWNIAYTNLTANSAAYLSAVDLTVLNSNSANWISVYNTVSANSSTTWNYQGDDLKALSAYWQIAYTNLTSTSAAYLSAVDLTVVNSNSANWISVYNTVSSNSATTWNYQGNDLKALSAYWQIAYTNLTSTSAAYLSGADPLVLISNSANWNTAYDISTAYQSNSSSFATFNYVNSSFLPLSGGTMSGSINLGNNNITNVNIISATQIYTVSAFTQYEDITIYELSGFGITGNVSITGDNTITGGVSANNANFSYVDFISSANPPYFEGRLHYNSAEHTLALDSYLNNNVPLNYGRDLFVIGVNKNGSSLPLGTVVYLSGAQGNRPKMWPAIGINDSSTATTIGVIPASVDVNAEGFIFTNGIVEGIDTRAFNPGDLLFVSPLTAGALTNVAPQAPYHAVRIGFALNSTVNGKIFVNVLNGYELGELHNVLITNPQNNQILVYNSLSSIWVNNGNTNYWDSTYTTVAANSANWQSVYASFNSQSATNTSVYSTVNTNSANWQNTYSTYSANSGGYALLSADNTFTARQIYTQNNLSSLSAAPLLATGTWLTAGGTATSTKPQFLIEPTGTTSTGWATLGTGLGVNAPAGFTGSIADLQLNGKSMWRFVPSNSTTGTLYLPGTTTTTNNIQSTGNTIIITAGSSGVVQMNGGRFALEWGAYLSYGAAGSSDVYLYRESAATLKMGADAASPISQTFKSHDARAGTDTNATGANLTVAAGRGTGTGNGGSLIFATAPPNAASGTAAGTLSARMTISPTGAVTVNNTLSSGNIIYDATGNSSQWNTRTNIAVMGAYYA